MADGARGQLLGRFAATWPDGWRLAPDGSAPTNHPLTGTLREFLARRAASLPYFGSAASDVAWCTVAANAEELRAAVHALQAWILPSFGWEEGTRTSAQGSEVSALLLATSPGGYLRWKCSRAQVERVASKLEAMLRLESRRPLHVFERVPSLLELRQRFSVALAAGDRESAEAAIQAIDRRLLDTAVNTHFMRIRMQDQFRDWTGIATYPALPELMRIRVPNLIRLAVLRGLHGYYLAAPESRGDVHEAARVYRESIHPIVTEQLALCRPEDGDEVRRCLGYRAWVLHDAREARRLLEAAPDTLLAPLLQPLAAECSPQPDPPLDTRWQLAVGQQDARAVQDVGLQLLEKARDPAVAGALMRQLADSLRTHIHPGVSEALRRMARALESEPISLVPTTWEELEAALRERQWSVVSVFLATDGRPSAAAASANVLNRFLDALEDCLTDASLDSDGQSRDAALSALLAIIHDLRMELDFPSSRHESVFPNLLRLFTARSTGSLNREDGALFLLLGSAVLETKPGAETALLEDIRSWWAARPISMLLPFLREALSMVAPYALRSATGLALWTQGAELLRRLSVDLTPEERRAWRRLGQAFGASDEALDSYLPPTSPEFSEVDFLARASLKKIAIVSRQERQAREAAEQIEERSRAKVVVVTDKAGGASTREAASADIILLVWATISHAVYRAFDSVRDRIAYVQGTGAESIVLALERELSRRGD